MTLFFESLESRRLLAGGNILFIRGATRSGGFLEATDAAARDLQLADINNTSTAAGNTGWGTLAAELRNAGYTVSQMTETKEKVEDGSGFTRGRPVRFELMDLTLYTAIVFGSNNARYEEAQINAVDSYIKNGGSALFISDANFGSHWRDAADSDQQFLGRFGVTVHQDNAAPTRVYSQIDFADAQHAILHGITQVSAEGVSPVNQLGNPPPGVAFEHVIAAQGNVRQNNGIDAANKFQGTIRAAGIGDAALLAARAYAGKIIAYQDRNTFFNANGLGADITQNDNRQLALNMFEWLTDKVPPHTGLMTFTPGAPHEVKIAFDDRILGLSRADILIRDPITAVPLPRTRWGWALDEVNGKSVLSIHIKAATPSGTYQLQINPHKFIDDAGNANARRIRFNFTLV